MPVPKHNKVKPRKTMTIKVMCYKSDYKAESCRHRPCEKCSCYTDISDFDLLHAELVEVEDE